MYVEVPGTLLLVTRSRLRYQIHINGPLGDLPTGAGSYYGLVLVEFRICYRGGIVKLDILIQIL